MHLITRVDFWKNKNKYLNIGKANEITEYLELRISFLSDRNFAVINKEYCF